MKRSLKSISPVITSHAVGEKRVLLSRSESGCDLTQIAVTDLQAGEVALAHIHPDMQEGFYVLDGDLDVMLNDEVLHCHKDDFVYVESGTAHELHAITKVRVMTLGCEIASKRNQLYPFVFKPNLHPVIWGGSRLKPWKQMPSKVESVEKVKKVESVEKVENGKESTPQSSSIPSSPSSPSFTPLSPSFTPLSPSSPSSPIGESWEVSAVPSSPSIIDNGCWAGMSLIDVINQMPNEILGRAVAKKYGNKLPLLVKFIDADKDLSIQVHPDDKMALREHNKFGKTEMWYVIDAKPGAYLYAGFKEELTPEEFCDLIKSSSHPSFRDSSHPSFRDSSHPSNPSNPCSEQRDITSVLARHEVHTGDVFYLPAGRIHAIGGGILLAEVQQTSDVTYRIYDYNRPGLDGKPRELHTELATKALDYKVYDKYRTDYTVKESASSKILDSPFFNVRVVDIDQRFHRNLVKYDSFVITMCIKGSCHIKIRSTQDEVVLHEGNSCLIPAAIADYDVEPIEGHSLLLDAFIDNRKSNIPVTKDGILKKLSRFFHIK